MDQTSLSKGSDPDVKEFELRESLAHPWSKTISDKQLRMELFFREYFGYSPPNSPHWQVERDGSSTD